MTIISSPFAPLDNLAKFTVPLYQLARGKLDYQKAVEAGEIWTKTTLRLALTTAMFFSYRFALSMGNPLLTVPLIVVNTCIHPRANINALFLTSVVRTISTFLQFHSISSSLNAEFFSKGELPPERYQFYTESSRKARVNGSISIAFLPISAALHILYFDSPKKLDPSENQEQPMTLLQKAKHYSLWLDRKIIAASKVAAPYIAAGFGYRPTTP